MRITLVRHGEAEKKKGEHYDYDHGLTSNGTIQVESLAGMLLAKERAFDYIVCSPLLRVRETSEILSRRLGLPLATPCQQLCEIGESDIYLDESLPSFLDRVNDQMNVLSDHPRNDSILAITLAGFLMTTIRTLFNIPTPGSGAREPGYASTTERSIVEGVWTLDNYNVSPTT